MKITNSSSQLYVPNPQFPMSNAQLGIWPFSALFINSPLDSALGAYLAKKERIS